MKLRDKLRAAVLAAALGVPLGLAMAGPPDPGRVGRLPSCPSGKFCTTKKEAAAKKVEGSKQRLSCPTELTEVINEDGMPGGSGRIVRLDDSATKARRKKVKNACCYTWVRPCPGGRPLRERGSTALARLRRGDSWSAAHA